MVMTSLESKLKSTNHEIECNCPYVKPTPIPKKSLGKIIVKLVGCDTMVLHLMILYGYTGGPLFHGGLHRVYGSVD